jgi:hypothetical protein
MRDSAALRQTDDALANVHFYLCVEDVHCVTAAYVELLDENGKAYARSAVTAVPQQSSPAP